MEMLEGWCRGLGKRALQQLATMGMALARLMSNSQQVVMVLMVMVLAVPMAMAMAAAGSAGSSSLLGWSKRKSDSLQIVIYSADLVLV